MHILITMGLLLVLMALMGLTASTTINCIIESHKDWHKDEYHHSIINMLAAILFLGLLIVEIGAAVEIRGLVK